MSVDGSPLCHYTWPILTKSILTTGGQMFTIKRYWTEKELWEMITKMSFTRMNDFFQTCTELYNVPQVIFLH